MITHKIQHATAFSRYISFILSATGTFQTHNITCTRFYSTRSIHQMKNEQQESKTALYHSSCHESSNRPSYFQPYRLMSRWKPDRSLSHDENYMDIVMILTRSVNFRQGSMGCIIVKPLPDTNTTSCDESSFFGAIIGASTNQSLFHANDSDIHAEIATLGVCLQHGNSTRGCTIYITMPPCKRCFGALCAAGIHRIVTSKEYAQSIRDAAAERGIELVTMDRHFVHEQRERIGTFISIHSDLIEDHSRRRRPAEQRRPENGMGGVVSKNHTNNHNNNDNQVPCKKLKLAKEIKHG